MSHFVDSKKEYHITNMFPKRPWMNYAWNEAYVSSFDQFGFGMSRYSDKSGFFHNILKAEAPNRLLFIKDEKSGEYYAANRNFDNKPFDKFETHVGMGYSHIFSEYNGIATELKLFVPNKGLMEYWEVSVENTSNEDKQISLYAYACLDMGLTIHWSYSEAYFSKLFNGLFCSHKAYLAPSEIQGLFFATNRKVDAFETTDRRFKGVYNHISHPLALDDETLSSQVNCFENEAAPTMQFRLNLKAGQKECFKFVLGATTTEDEAAKICNAALKDGVFETDFAAVQDKINDFQTNVMVETPDPEINSRVNIWLKRQVELGKQWGRLYGKGFRDIMQDIAGFLSLAPENARDRILYTFSHQRINGNPVRQWDPYMEEVYTDGAAWMFYTLNAYLKETGDLTILDEKIPYFDSDEMETVLDHCFRGMNFLQNELGEHGMCLWGVGDWNDSLNGCGILGKGESLWLSEATVKAVNDFEEILQVSGHADAIPEIRAKADKMTANMFKYGWDKDHFIYGINDYNEKIGSYDTPEGQIFLNSQVWAILSGIVKGEDAVKLMDTAEEKLGCEFGYVQQAPSYSKGSDRIGRSSYFIPGLYENGSVYNHGVAFKVVADCVLRDGDRALDTLYRILPCNPNNNYEKSGVEPYAMCNMYLGPECECRRGEAPLNWTTGTNGWVFRGVVENILGVRADFNGLKVDPVLPKKWDTVKVTRIFRGATYHITIDNTAGTGNYVLTMDGKTVEGNVLPLADGGEHVVLAKAI